MTLVFLGHFLDTLLFHTGPQEPPVSSLYLGLMLPLPTRGPMETQRKKHDDVDDCDDDDDDKQPKRPSRPSHKVPIFACAPLLPCPFGPHLFFCRHLIVFGLSHPPSISGKPGCYLPPNKPLTQSRFAVNGSASFHLSFSFIFLLLIYSFLFLSFLFGFPHGKRARRSRYMYQGS